jgi:hypothetical protein
MIEKKIEMIISGDGTNQPKLTVSEVGEKLFVKISVPGYGYGPNEVDDKSCQMMIAKEDVPELIEFLKGCTQEAVTS